MNENKASIFIETSSYPTDQGHLKKIVLDIQTKRFIVENGQTFF